MSITSSMTRPLPMARQKQIWRRLAVASVLVLLLHLVFFTIIAPNLSFEPTHHNPTEVVQITPQELNKLKRQILKKQELNPLLQDEIREEYRSKEAPKDAQMMGPHNQVVPKEQMAGPQADAPKMGSGSQGRQNAQKREQSRTEKSQAAPREKLDLSKLGLGTKVPPPAAQAEPREQSRAQGRPGPKGPPGEYRPVGREAKNVDKGDQNLLNAVESEYYSFFARLEEPIVRNWYFLLRNNEGQIRQEMANRRIKSGAELPVTLEFVLDRQGNFRSIEIIESSGVPTLDWATKESVRKLGSLPNPPPGLFETGQYFTRRLQFVVHVSDTPIIQSRPDLYW